MLSCLRISLLVAFIGAGCSTGVEDDPGKGIIRVFVSSNPADTSIVIANKIFVVKSGDTFVVKFVQGKVYIDSTFFILYPDTTSYTQEDRQFNILAMSDSSGYQEFRVFESFLPAGFYDRLQFGLTATEVVLRGNHIPISLPPGEMLLMDFPLEMFIEEERVTEIRLVIWPFQSIRRYQDSFHFHRRIEIKEIRYES